MKLTFEELDFQTTPLGDISLRRRAEPRLNGQLLYEVKLNDEYLMSSLFTESETRLATLGLALLPGTDLDIIVGGLGLGYTAAAVLNDPHVRSMTVIEVLAPVIDWHRQGLVPLGKTLTADPRCRLLQADFFALAVNPAGFDPAAPGQKVHAVLLDIDHSPTYWLHADNQAFYTQQGLLCLAHNLHPGGVFGLWSNDPPDAGFQKLLGTVFESSQTHVISFANPYQGGESSCTVYLALKGDTSV